MKKQEAIEILRDTPIDIRSTREDDIHTLYATAQGMAIEALQRGLENVNADSCSEKSNRSEPKTAESGSVDSEMPEIKTDRTIGGMIYRQDAIEVAKKHWYKPDIAKALEELPSEQPEIIRCKDCWHYPSEYADCPMIGWARNENDFCSKAERRTDEIN